MQSKIVLVSDDLNFFEYVIPKLTLRKSDELYRFSFDDLPNKIQFLKGAALIINSESAEDKTLELLINTIKAKHIKEVWFEAHWLYKDKLKSFAKKFDGISVLGNAD